MMGSKSKPIKQEYIPDFPLKNDFNKYYHMVIRDFQTVKVYFPLLKITCLPTVNPKEIFITGNLIPIEVYQECVTLEDIERNSIHIFAIYPNNYPNDNIYVEDLGEKINWSKIP